MHVLTSKRGRPGAASLAVAGTLAVVAAPLAFGYATKIHEDFYALAFGDRQNRIDAPSAQDLSSLRTGFYARASKDSAFRSRYPSEASFDDAAFKEFLALNPTRSVVGIDATGVPSLPGFVPQNGTISEADLGRFASRCPDDDTRNQDRMFVKDGTVALDPFGRAVPYDPKTTWFGGLTGTPSQFDAHGATVRGVEHGSGVITAFLHPERFSRPPVDLGSAPEFSQSYTDLDLVSSLQGGRYAEWQQVQFAGATFHGVEDVANQIHTTLIGIPEFFLDAKITYYEMKIKNFFSRKKSKGPGTPSAGPPASLTPEEVRDAVAKIEGGKESEVDPRVLYAIGKEPGGQLTDVDLGIRIIGNHHRLLEDFFMVEYTEGMAKVQAGRAGECRPEIREIHRRALAGDKAFEKKCRDALAKAGYGTKKPGEVQFAKVITECMIEASSPEAAPIYRAIRSIAKKELRRGAVFPADVPGTDARDWLTIKRGERTKETDLIFELHARAFARVVTALRLWREVLDAELKAAQADKDGTLDRIVSRVTATQLKYLDDAKARRDKYLVEKSAEYKKAHPDTAGIVGGVK